jgi:DHA2 family multidrug resistance protein-like MFS transporter
MALDGNGAELPGLETLGWLALSLATGAAFLARQRRAPYPLMALSMFEERRFTLAVSSQGLAFVGQGLAFVALSFLYQQGMGFSPLETAWLFTPWPLTIMVAGPLAGRLADRLNPSLLSSAGLVLLMVGLGSLARLEADAEVIDCLWRTALCGLGFGFFQPPNNRELMGSVPAEKSANASGVMSTTRTVGQSLGVALVGACLAAGAPVQVALWAGVIATGLSLMASLGRVSLAGEAQRARRLAAVERVQ